MHCPHCGGPLPEGVTTIAEMERAFEKILAKIRTAPHGWEPQPPDADPPAIVEG